MGADNEVVPALRQQPGTRPTPLGGIDLIDRTCSLHECSSPSHCRGWCRKHYERWRKHGDPLRPPFGAELERFEAKCIEGPVPQHRPDLGPCRLWIGALTWNGYGRINATEHNYAHRWAYVTFIGPIPAGLQVDHLCRVRNCTRETHLELVTNQENAERGTAGDRQRARTHCPHGHPYDEENTVLSRGGRHRQCRACRAERRERGSAA